MQYYNNFDDPTKCQFHSFIKTPTENVGSETESESSQNTKRGLFRCSFCDIADIEMITGAIRLFWFGWMVGCFSIVACQEARLSRLSLLACSKKKKNYLMMFTKQNYLIWYVYVNKLRFMVVQHTSVLYL